MADPEKKTTDVTEGEKNQQVTIPPKEAVPIVLSGAEKFLDGELHYGIAVLVTSDGKPSVLMIPDVTKVKDGAPVYITKPIRIKGEHLEHFLTGKNIKLPENVSKLIATTKISCEAFYYSKDGPLVMMFALNFADEKGEGGLIGTLTDEPDLGKLFEIQGASLRILRCPEKSFEVLQKYSDELSA